MKRIFLTTILLSLVFQLKAQQIGNGYVVRANDFSIPLLSGMYHTDVNQDGFPTNSGSSSEWKYLLNIRNNNANNHHQFQLATSYAENDRLFFRKIAATTLDRKNTLWYEVATRGANTFSGVQTFNGSIKGNAEGGSVRLQNTNGYLEFGPRNTSCAHFMTDRTYFYFNKTLLVNGKIGSYRPSNLYLQTNYIDRLTILNDNGYVGIGTTAPRNMLDVNGVIRAKEVKIEASPWPDYVFAPDYKLPTLQEVARHIEENQHLPGIPSAAEVAEDGVDLGAMNAKLLQKIEELTLYVIQQQELIERQQESLEKQQASIEDLQEKIENIHNP